MWIDRGGAWIGPGQDRIHALMDEFGVPEYKQHNDGDAMMIVDGKKHRYGSTIPWSMSPWAVANLGLGLLSMEKMCNSIPREAPGRQSKPTSGTASAWANGSTRTRCPSRPARCWTWRWPGVYTSAASETSLLWHARWSAGSSTIGGPTFVISGKGGAQDARPVGGMGAIYRQMAAELGDALHLSQPVRQIAQDADGVTVRSDDLTVRARRVIVAIPLAIASSIDYEPMLPLDRAFLHQRMPGGAIFKISIFYDEPFWRADGLSGQSTSPGSPVTLTIDACTDTAMPGIMCVITEGPAARRLSSSTRPSAKRWSSVNWWTGSAARPAHRSSTTSRTGLPSAIPAAG